MRPPPFENFRRDFRKHPQQVRYDAEFIERCMRAWDAGLNSREIAIAFMQPEAIIEVALWTGREQRRRNQQWNQPAPSPATPVD